MGSRCQFGECSLPDLNLTSCHVVSTCLTVNNDTWAKYLTPGLDDTCHTLDRDTCDQQFWIKGGFFLLNSVKKKKFVLLHLNNYTHRLLLG